MGILDELKKAKAIWDEEDRKKKPAPIPASPQAPVLTVQAEPVKDESFISALGSGIAQVPSSAEALARETFGLVTDDPEQFRQADRVRQEAAKKYGLSGLPDISTEKGWAESTPGDVARYAISNAPSSIVSSGPAMAVGAVTGGLLPSAPALVRGVSALKNVPLIGRIVKALGPAGAARILRSIGAAGGATAGAIVPEAASIAGDVVRETGQVPPVSSTLAAAIPSAALEGVSAVPLLGKMPTRALEQMSPIGKLLATMVSEGTTEALQTPTEEAAAESLKTGSPLVQAMLEKFGDPETLRRARAAGIVGAVAGPVMGAGEIMQRRQPPQEVTPPPAPIPTPEQPPAPPVPPAVPPAAPPVEEVPASAPIPEAPPAAGKKDVKKTIQILSRSPASQSDPAAFVQAFTGKPIEALMKKEHSQVRREAARLAVVEQPAQEIAPTPVPQAEQPAPEVTPVEQPAPEPIPPAPQKEQRKADSLKVGDYFQRDGETFLVESETDAGFEIVGPDNKTSIIPFDGSTEIDPGSLVRQPEPEAQKPAEKQEDIPFMPSLDPRRGRSLIPAEVGLDVMRRGSQLFKSGVKSFVAWSKKMIKEFGDRARKWLVPLWERVRQGSSLMSLRGRTGAAIVQSGLTQEPQEKGTGQTALSPADIPVKRVGTWADVLRLADVTPVKELSRHLYQLDPNGVYDTVDWQEDRTGAIRPAPNSTYRIVSKNGGFSIQENTAMQGEFPAWEEARFEPHLPDAKAWVEDADMSVQDMNDGMGPLSKSDAKEALVRFKEDFSEMEWNNEGPDGAARVGQSDLSVEQSGPSAPKSRPLYSVEYVLAKYAAKGLKAVAQFAVDSARSGMVFGKFAIQAAKRFAGPAWQKAKVIIRQIWDDAVKTIQAGKERMNLRQRRGAIISQEDSRRREAAPKPDKAREKKFIEAEQKEADDIFYGRKMEKQRQQYQSKLDKIGKALDASEGKGASLQKAKIDAAQVATLMLPKGAREHVFKRLAKADTVKKVQGVIDFIGKRSPQAFRTIAKNRLAKMISKVKRKKLLPHLQEKKESLLKGITLKDPKSIATLVKNYLKSSGMVDQGFPREITDRLDKVSAANVNAMNPGDIDFLADQLKFWYQQNSEEIANQAGRDLVSVNLDGKKAIDHLKALPDLPATEEKEEMETSLARSWFVDQVKGGKALFAALGDAGDKVGNMLKAGLTKATALVHLVTDDANSILERESGGKLKDLSGQEVEKLLKEQVEIPTSPGNLTGRDIEKLLKDQAKIPTEAGKKKLSWWAVLDIYNHSQAEYNRYNLLKNGAAVKYKMSSDKIAFDEAALAGIKALVEGNKDMSAIAKAIMGGFNNKLKAAMNKASVRLMGYEVATVPVYYPAAIFKGEGQSNLNQQFRFAQNTIENSGFLKGREGSTKSIALMDPIDRLNQHVRQASIFAELGVPLRLAKLFLGSVGDPSLQQQEGEKSLRAMITQKLGKRYYDMLNRRIDSLEGMTDDVSPWVSAAKSFYSMITSGFLGLNPRTYAVMYGGLVNLSSRLNPADVVKNFGKVVTSKKTRQDVYETLLKNTYFRDRLESNERVVLPKVEFSDPKKRANFFLGTLNDIDSHIMETAWLTVKDENPGKSDEEISSITEEIFRETQNPSTPWEQSDLALAGKKEFWLTPFSFLAGENFSRANAIMTAWDSFKRGKIGTGDMLRRVAVMGLFTAISGEVIRGIYNAAEGSTKAAIRKAMGYEDEPEKEKDTSEKAWKAFVSTLKSMAGMTPGGSEIVAMVESARRAARDGIVTAKPMKTGGPVGDMVADAWDDVQKTLTAMAPAKEDKRGRPKEKNYNQALKGFARLIPTVLALRGIPRYPFKVAADILLKPESEKVKKARAKYGKK